MKSKLFALAFGLTMSMSAAIAGPVQALPGGPIYLKFNGNEQLAVAPGATTWAADPSKKEINWGVFTMTTMHPGAVEDPNSTIGQNGPAFFSDSVNSQVTGMFYGVQGLPAGTGGNPFPATSGFIDLWWRDIDAGMSYTNNAVGGPGIRTAFDKATGYTEGTFLARIRFDSGINVDPSVFINGSVFPNAAGTFSGVATSFGSIDLAAGGAWATQLDTNYFNTDFGQRDLRFRNNYENKASWDGAPGSGIRGARLDDPGQAFAIPEPGVLALMGLAFLGMGAARRRRNK